MRDILSTLREIRSRNAGHLFFFMTPAATPFLLDASGNPRKTTPAADAFYGFSDIFSAKGMYAAARYLKDDEAAAEALDYIRQVDDAIWQGAFVNDQQTLDPKDPVQVKPGCHFHGPYMSRSGPPPSWPDTETPTASNSACASSGTNWNTTSTSTDASRTDGNTTSGKPTTTGACPTARTERSSPIPATASNASV